MLVTLPGRKKKKKKRGKDLFAINNNSPQKLENVPVLKSDSDASVPAMVFTGSLKLTDRHTDTHPV